MQCYLYVNALVEMTYGAKKYLHLESGLHVFIDQNMVVGTRDEVEEGMQIIGDSKIEDLIAQSKLIPVNSGLSIQSIEPKSTPKIEPNNEPISPISSL